MSWALVSVYGTDTDWSKVANTGNTAVINGKTVPVDYNNFVLGPVSAAAGEFWRDALSYLIITGLARVRRRAHERRPALHVRDGPRRAHAALPRQDAPGAQVAVHRGAHVGRRWRRAVPALPRHEPHRPGRLLLALAAGRDLDRARAGADGALGLHVLPHACIRASSRGRRPSARGSASPASSSCSRSSTTTRRSWPPARSIYVKELFTIGSGTWSVPVSWLGIIGVDRAGGSRWATPTCMRAQQPGEVRAHGPLRERVCIDPDVPGRRLCGGARHASQCESNRLRPVAPFSAGSARPGGWRRPRRRLMPAV